MNDLFRIFGFWFLLILILGFIYLLSGKTMFLLIGAIVCQLALLHLAIKAICSKRQ